MKTRSNLRFDNNADEERSSTIHGPRSMLGAVSDEASNFQEYYMDGAASSSTLRRRRKSKAVSFEGSSHINDINEDYQRKSKEVSVLDDQSTLVSESIHPPKDFFTSSCQQLPLSPRITCHGVPEVHWIGEIHRGSGFSQAAMACKWMLEWGESWCILEGNSSGQSQYSFLSDEGTYIWNHPIDLHLACNSLKGMPRIIVQLWELDEYDRLNHVGFGFAHLPLSSGETCLTIPCWRPYTTVHDEIRGYFLGNSLTSPETAIVYSKAWDNRHNWVTIPLGQVHIRLSTITRYMTDQFVEMA